MSKRLTTKKPSGRTRLVWCVQGEEGTLIVPCTKGSPDNWYKDLKDVLFYASLPTEIGETCTLNFYLKRIPVSELKNMNECDGI